jgi:hypothetical protein
MPLSIGPAATRREMRSASSSLPIQRSLRSSLRFPSSDCCSADTLGTSCRLTIDVISTLPCAI